MFRGEKMKSKLTIIMIVLLSALLIFTGCSFNGAEESKEDSQEQSQEEVAENLDEKELAEEIDDMEKQLSQEEVEEEYNFEDDYKAVSPFTGLAVSENYYKRAVAVAVENSPAARPQSGLNKAPIVYEFMLEGGITRFLAIYWPEVPEKIGPIRSARPALIETAQFYDALFLHAGASPRGFALLSVNDILHLDQIYKSKYFWRSSKKAAPHNLYSGQEILNDYLKKLPEKEYPDQFNFLTVSIISDFDQAENITVDYWGSYSVIYKYNSLDNNYLRYLNNENNAHRVENGEQIKVNNIIVQHVKTATIDDQDRQDIDLQSGGKMQLFRDGIVIKGSWKRENGKIIYLNEAGKKIETNPGKTWIQVVPNGTDINY